MDAGDQRARAVQWCLATSLFWVTGCQHLQVPAIDPTGERIFSSTGRMQCAALSDTRCTTDGPLFPRPAWQEPVTPPPCPEPPPPAPPGAPSPGCGAPRTIQPRAPVRGVPGRLLLNPTRLIAPVGSEVVVVGGLCGEDGYLVTNQDIEWNLSQDSVGQIVDFSNRGRFWSGSRKLSANYAVTGTSCRSEIITRGTPSVTDDITQLKGQCWISLTSASEGTSYVTAVATNGATWPQRRQAAIVHWVDCQWAFPNPVAVPAGQAHTLVTHLTRTATEAPVAGMILRYEVVDGTPAVFGPAGETAAEVRSDENGLGQATLQPTSPLAGVTQVKIEVIRPPDPRGDAPRTKLGEGYTSITWSAPGLTLRATGPAAAEVDTTLTYRVEVHNPGDLPARNVTLRDVLPPTLQYLNSNPPAQLVANRAQWQLGDLSPHSLQVVEINVRALAGGAVRYAFQATTAEGLQADTYVDTQLAQAALRLNVSGPATAAVGERIQFRIDVTNVGTQPLDNVTVTDRFDASLEHVEGMPSPIQKLLGRLEPGRTEQFGVGFLVRRAGSICHILEVSAPGGQYAQHQACLTATAAAAAPQPRLEVVKTAPTDARVGQTAQFSTRVTNTGNVPLTNVRITDTYDPALEPKESTPGWDPTALAAGQLVWVVPRLEPGETLRRDVLCTCQLEADRASSRVTVSANEQVTETAEAAVRIGPGGTTGARAPGPSAAAGQLRLEIFEVGDPIRVGEATDYEIRIRNERAVSDRNVSVRIEFPAGLRFERLSGPVPRRNVSADGRTVEVSPVREIRAGESLPSFHVEATGVQIGEHTMRVTVTSELTPQGVMAEESTSVTAQ